MTSGPADIVDVGHGGLSEAAVAERVARGATNDVPTVPTRSVAQIVRTNVFTLFNAILGGLLAVILVVGDPRDALFGLVLIANSAIGIVQELRAKRTLDRLAPQAPLPLLTGPSPLEAELAALDLDGLTPLQAMTKLYELKAKATGG